MPETAAQQIKDPEISKFVDGIAPTLKKMLKKRWDRLLWEPRLSIGDHSVIGVSVPSSLMSIRHNSDYLASSTREYYVTADGSIHSATFSRYTGSRAPKKGPTQPINLAGEIESQEYPYLAAEAGAVLNSLRDKQEEELANDPEGKDVIWRPGTRLFDTYWHQNDPLNPERGEPVIVRAKLVGQLFKLFCPQHPNVQLERTPWHPNATIYTSCPRSPRTHMIVNSGQHPETEVE